MSKVKGIKISFPGSGSPDVVWYKLYMAEAPAAVGYESESFDLGKKTEVDLAELESMADREGVFNIGITAVDDAGNESPMSVLEGVPAIITDQASPIPNPTGDHFRDGRIGGAYRLSRY